MAEHLEAHAFDAGAVAAWRDEAASHDDLSKRARRVLALLGGIDSNGCTPESRIPLASEFQQCHENLNAICRIILGE